MPHHETLDDMFENIADQQRKAAVDQDNDPCHQTRMSIKRNREALRHQRNGVMDADGNWIITDDDIEPDD